METSPALGVRGVYLLDKPAVESEWEKLDLLTSPALGARARLPGKLAVEPEWDPHRVGKTSKRGVNRKAFKRGDNTGRIAYKAQGRIF